MNYDFYAIKVQAENRTSDDYFLGYFFGKVNSGLEYRFICFPKKYVDREKTPLEMPFAEYKDYLNELYLRISSRSLEIVEMTKEFNVYLGLQIRKMGGMGAQGFRFSKMAEEKNTELIRSELNDLFQNWTSDIILRFTLDFSSFSQIYEQASLSVDTKVMLSSFGADRKDILSISDFYPLLDPMAGVTIDQYEIGSVIWCTISRFSNQTEENRLKKEYPDFFDEAGGNIVPFEGTLVLKELTADGRGVLVKVMIADWFFAKSIILHNMRLLQNTQKLQNRFPKLQEQSFQIGLDNPQARPASKGTTNTAHLENKKPIFDLGTVFIIFAIIALAFLIYFFFFYS